MPDAPLPSLRYVDVRDSIQDGDIVLFKGKSLLSRLIRWFTRSEYTHAGIAVWWRDRLMLLEAVDKGVWAVPLSWRLATYQGTAHLLTPDEHALRENNLTLDRARLVASAQSELGKEYATWLLVRIARKIVFRWKGGADPWKPPQRFVCSQYVSRVYRDANVDLDPDEPDRFTTPKDIAESEFLRARGLLYTEMQGQAARYLAPSVAGQLPDTV